MGDVTDQECLGGALVLEERALLDDIFRCRGVHNGDGELRKLVRAPRDLPGG